MSETEQKPEKPRGKCTGCAFEYQLGTARSGDYKGELVIRKHNSRVGPGLCSGAQKPPRTPPAPMPLPGERDSDFREVLSEHNADVQFTSPAPVQPHSLLKPFHAGFGHEGSCGHDIYEGDLIQSDGEGGYLCTYCIDEADNPSHPNDNPDGRTPEQQAEIDRRMADPIGSALATLPPVTGVVAVAPGGVPVSAPDPFTSPAPASDIPEKTVTVSGQPEPDRDRWGRYLIHGQAHTRATTFAKLGANTKAIEAWNERNVIVGLTRREDLLMLAQGKEVKRDRDDLNSIAQQAKDAAGSKVAANIGTAYHSFSERIDAGLMTLNEVPEKYRPRVQQYTDTVRACGLVTRPEWIERTTAVRGDQVSAPLPVGGMLDRIFQMPDGSFVIGDLKTGSDLSYGEMEIEVQLAIYAHGVNTHGLFDWNTKQWDTSPKVRTDIAIVMHLPADGDGCHMYVADIERGWADAQKLGQLQASLKTKKRFRLLTRADLGVPVQPAPQAPEPSPAITQAQQEWDLAVSYFSRADTKDQLSELYQYALDSGRFTDQQLGTLAAIGQERLTQLALRT